MMQCIIECHPTACSDGSIAPKQSDRPLSILSERKQNQALKPEPLFVGIHLMELQQSHLKVLQHLKREALLRIRTNSHC